MVQMGSELESSSFYFTKWSHEESRESMRGTGCLRARGLQASAGRPEVIAGSTADDNMKLSLRSPAHRLMWLALIVLVLLVLVILSLQTRTEELFQFHVTSAHKQLVHENARRVLEGDCRHRGSREKLLALFPSASGAVHPFLWRDQPLPAQLLSYPPPFGFKGLKDKVEDLLTLPQWILVKATKSLRTSDLISSLCFQLPAAQTDPGPEECRRCVVVGNGGVLKGLELGQQIDRFHTVIRLNSGPLGKHTGDVGNRTSIRMSYPEGTPLHWADTDSHSVFVAVIYKGVDLSWMSAMIRKLGVTFWDWFFFWQRVPQEIPLDPSRFRLLNPDVIRQTALDFLEYPEPRWRLWGWDQNIPTLGVSALSLASLLCDEVSLVGFGYNLSQQGAPLHYYDSLPMSLMQQQNMHNVDKETQFLYRLVREGVVTDLTGGIHCSFCSS